MVNSKSRKTGIIVLTAIILVLSAVVISAADGVAPGSEQDPIVTQSYVEQKSEQIKYYIDSMLAQETAKLKTELELKGQEIAKLREEIKDAAKAAGKFQVVEMQK
ncbi:MAG TPA: hypothetical protein P5021_00545, partial [Candidatus Diapherotrites archaeon]|nr:hypothetical protein [Candidatus Diapherotrites archaeon]